MSESRRQHAYKDYPASKGFLKHFDPTFKTPSQLQAIRHDGELDRNFYKLYPRSLAHDQPKPLPKVSSPVLFWSRISTSQKANDKTGKSAAQERYVDVCCIELDTEQIKTEDRGTLHPTLRRHLLKILDCDFDSGAKAAGDHPGSICAIQVHIHGHSTILNDINNQVTRALKYTKDHPKPIPTTTSTPQSSSSSSTSSSSSFSVMDHNNDDIKDNDDDIDMDDDIDDPYTAAARIIRTNNSKSRGLKILYHTRDFHNTNTTDMTYQSITNQLQNSTELRQKVDTIYLTKHGDIDSNSSNVMRLNPQIIERILNNTTNNFTSTTYYLDEASVEGEYDHPLKRIAHTRSNHKHKYIIHEFKNRPTTETLPNLRLLPPIPPSFSPVPSEQDTHSQLSTHTLNNIRISSRHTTPLALS